LSFLYSPHDTPLCSGFLIYFYGSATIQTGKYDSLTPKKNRCTV